MRERVALVAMSLIARHYAQGLPAWTLQQLTRRLGMPMHAVKVVLDGLVDGGVLASTRDEPPGYLPARDLVKTTIREMLEIVRATGEDRYLNPAALPVTAQVEEVLARIERGIDDTLGELSVAALAEERAARADSGATGERIPECESACDTRPGRARSCA